MQGDQIKNWQENYFPFDNCQSYQGVKVLGVMAQDMLNINSMYGIKYSVAGRGYIRISSFAIALMLIFCTILFSCNSHEEFVRKIDMLLENNGLPISNVVHVNKSSNSSAVTYAFILNKDAVIRLVNKLGLKPYDNPSNRFLQDNSEADPAWWRVEGPFDSGLLKDAEVKSILMMHGASESYLEITFTQVINDN